MKFLSLSLLIGILLQVSGSLVINLAFLANKAYIIHEVCVERNLEVNTCQGSCHLNKELKKHNSRPGDIALKEVSVLLVPAPLQASLQLDLQSGSAYDYAVPNQYTLSEGFTNSTLHPPRWC